MNEKELLELKGQIDDAKLTLTKAEARKDVLLEELKTKFNLSSVEAAVKKLDKMEADIDSQNEEIRKAIGEIEKVLRDE